MQIEFDEILFSEDISDSEHFTIIIMIQLFEMV